MIERMPTPHLVAMLRSVKPAEAARLLHAMPAERTAILLTELDPAHVARIVLAGDPDRCGPLLLAVPAEVRLAVLDQLTMGQFTQLLAVLEPQVACEVLRGMPPREIADVVSDLPAAIQPRLREALSHDQPPEFVSALYQRDAAHLLVRTAAAVSWLDQWTGDLLAEVLGKVVQVAVRYRQMMLTDIDVDQSARRGHWSAIAGMVLLTNVEPAASAEAHARAINQSGRPFQVIQWVDDDDSGMFKRALVRLVG